MSIRHSWIGPAFAMVAWSALGMGLAIYGYLYPTTHTVSDIYLRAARNWWSGEDLYRSPGSTAYYRYSPLFAVGLTPLAYLPESWGNALWRLLNWLVYAAGLCAWCRHVVPGSRTRIQFAGLLLCAIPASLQSLQNAQANLFVLGVILLGLAGAVEGRWNRAAAWLALATLVKGYPLALALLLMVAYRRRFALRFAAALSAGLLLPLAMQSPGIALAQYRSWFDHLRDSTILMRERLRSLDYLFSVSHHPVAPQTFLYLQALAGLLVLALFLFHVSRVEGRREQLTMVFLLFAAWSVLFGPATEACSYAITGPAISWAMVEAFSRRAAWPTRLLLLASLLLMGPLATDLFGPTVRNFCNEHACQPIGALLFVMYLTARLGRPYHAAVLIDSDLDPAPLYAPA